MHHFFPEQLCDQFYGRKTDLKVDVRNKLNDKLEEIGRLLWGELEFSASTSN
jgi:hypothetical protein